MADRFTVTSTTPGQVATHSGGTLAARPASPAAGDTYAVTTGAQTGARYTCFVTGSWEGTALPTASASLLPLCSYATNDGPLTAVGRLRFDPALFAVPGCTLAVALEAVGDVSDAGLTGTATLHDLTDAADVATLSWTETSATVKTASVTVPGAAHTYELRASLSGGAGYLTLGAVLRLTWS